MSILFKKFFIFITAFILLISGCSVSDNINKGEESSNTSDNNIEFSHEFRYDGESYIVNYYVDEEGTENPIDNAAKIAVEKLINENPNAGVYADPINENMSWIYLNEEEKSNISNMMYERAVNEFSEKNKIDNSSKSLSTYSSYGLQSLYYNLPCVWSDMNYSGNSLSTYYIPHLGHLWDSFLSSKNCYNSPHAWRMTGPEFYNWDDKISSISGPSQDSDWYWEVTIYEHPNRQGNGKAFSRNVWDLRRHSVYWFWNWNNRASSVKMYIRSKTNRDLNLNNYFQY